MARRLLVTYLTITALALVVVVVPLGRMFAERERDRLMISLERDAQAIASLSEDSLEEGQPVQVDSVLRGYGDDGCRAVVVDSEGISVADSADLGGARRDFSTRPEVAAALDGSRSSGTRKSETLDTDLVYVAVPVASGGTVHGAVRISCPTSTLDRRVDAMWWRLGLLCLLVLAIVAVVGMFFAREVTRPVRRLQLAASELAAGDLAVRVDADDGPPELRDLAATFNSTADQLEHLVGSQQRFVADASHQLRTPLTALRLRLEVLESSVDPPARPKLDAAIAETDRLARLVSSLLVLARSDATSPITAPVDLTAAVRDRFEAWEPVATESEVELRCSCPDGLWADTVPDAVGQILDNLLSNALDIVPVHTVVSIRVDAASDATAIDLHVVDQGPGMDAEARAQAFDRFWRSTERPADGSARKGFGLGLAIVEQLATRSGGRAHLDAGPGGVGLDAWVSLQRADGPAPAGPPAVAGSAAGSLPDPHLTQGRS